MHFNKLDLNLLVALNVLLRERSITRAAEQLHLSPSSLSHALARLRDYFQDELLVQAGRSMKLTPRAETLREEVPRLLHAIEAVVSPEPRFVPSCSHRTFRIYVSDYSLAVLVPHLLRLVVDSGFAGVVEFLPQRETPGRELDIGKADLLVVPQEFVSPDHPREMLYDEQFVSLVWAGSVLATGAMTSDRFNAARHVVMQPDIHGYLSIDAALIHRMGVRRKAVVSAYAFSALPSLVIGTDLVATVHRRLARQAQRTLPVVIKEPPFPLEGMRQMLQWNASHSEDQGLLWLRGLCHRAVQRMDEDGQEGSAASGAWRDAVPVPAGDGGMPG